MLHVPYHTLHVPYNLRPATISDAHHIARLVDFAGDGLYYHHWRSIAFPGTDPWTVGYQQVQSQTGDMSYTDTTLANISGRVLAGMVTYPIVEPHVDDENLPALFKPIVELENLAVDTYYISVLAAYPEFRGLGIGGRLLELAERKSANQPLSLIVNDGNSGAYRLYERRGFRKHTSRPIIKDDWDGAGDNWVLMMR